MYLLKNNNFFWPIYECQYNRSALMIEGESTDD